MRPFTDVIRDHRGGKLVDQLTKRLATVIAAVDDTGQPGTITLTLKVTPSKGDEGVYEVAPKISTTLPEQPLPKSQFFKGEDGVSLVREPPQGGALLSAVERESERGDRRSDPQAGGALRAVG